MSVEMACTCGGMPSHSHVFASVITTDDKGRRWSQMRDTGEVRVWVDWKAVARALSGGSGGQSA